MQKNDYQPVLNLLETQKAIKLIKDKFEQELAHALNLVRVSAPLFVFQKSGINDYLNGSERPVSFDALSFSEPIEIVQSLAKWKRGALKQYHIPFSQGIYADMNAIRRDENIDAIHSLYVDQWDWEKVINENQRNLNYLKKVVTDIYQVIFQVGQFVESIYPQLKNNLSKTITFISSSELEQRYPQLSRKEREKAICQECGSVFLYQIGWPLSDDKPHDGRASDYDDWNLNGDILVWYEPLQIGLELSSMGIRVDAASLIKQIESRGEISKFASPYVQQIINNELPLSIGGGIGQSRLCMYFLQKMHIGEVQASLWKEEDIKELSLKNIYLL